MSTKTIAVESTVYERLARAKRPSESFTKVIDRLLDAGTRGTCTQAVADMAEIWGAGPAARRRAEAGAMDRFLKQGRATTDWRVEKPS